MTTNKETRKLKGVREIKIKMLEDARKEHAKKEEIETVTRKQPKGVREIHLKLFQDPDKKC